MKVLIVGNGGREHALAWKAAQSNGVKKVYVAPGNGGTALEPGVTNLDIAATDIPALLKFAQDEAIDLTIVGPEAPLMKGIVDTFNEHGLYCLGPRAQAAQLESSKAFAKAFMQRHQIPTAGYASFTDLNAALDYIKNHPLPIVIKADGFAAGKGVVISSTLAEAEQTLKQMFAGSLGDAGKKVVIEEFIAGEEASYIILCDGEHFVSLASSQDHKQRDDGDVGPNTGGMGTYSPAPIVTSKLEQSIIEQIVKPTLNGLKAENIPYSGFLYIGLMIQPNGEMKVLEYNCRLGDPETQPLLFRLRSDFIAAAMAAVRQELSSVQLQWDPRPALTVVMASKGYPFEYPKHDAIKGLEKSLPAEVKVFHAGTELKDQQILTTGGRVLGVTALGQDIAQAQQLAYDVVKTISWDHCYYRRDIGHKAITKLKQSQDAIY